MQIVIEIPEDEYQNILLTGKASFRAVNAIEAGTPLPKGHGRLVDISQIDKDRIDRDNPIIYLTVNGEYIEAISLDYLESLPTVIEADKEMENIS